MDAKLLLTVEEVARLLGLSRTRTYDLVGTGAIGSVKIGRSRRVARAEVERFVAAL